MLAAGCAIELVDAVTRTGNPGFAAVRPPGHHAFPDQGCGFCIFNNVVIAAKHALKNGHSRVLIVDWDIHAGQGTQECIADDERICLISIHRYQDGQFWPNLQHSAVKTQFKNTINVPLNDIGMGDSEYLAIFQLIVHPVINDFKPDIMFVSCGFDAALGDPEGEMRLTPAGYATLTHQLMTWRVPLVMILEGGYFMDSIAAGFEWVAKAMLGDEIPRIDPEAVNSALVPVINRVLNVFGKTYPSLAIIQSVKRKLRTGEPTEEDDTEQYKGTRISLPFPTRGVYEAQDKPTALRFSEELRKIISSYSERKSYKAVHYVSQPTAATPFTYEPHKDHITLAISDEAKGIVHLLIGKSLNPLLPSAAFQLSLSAQVISSIAQLIKNLSNVADMPPLYISYL
ncbi:hypothetical protein KIN20_026691 [Parelaphostrongylus tenuis]|nr:hypothetical protein KIN20_026691 [Parelaphostrongylus tenuis]